MKLYIASFAPNPRRVRIYLKEKGLEDRVEQIRLDMVKGEHRTEEFRKTKNPLGMLPVLELDDGRVLTESMAIIEYLEELHPDPPLIGTDAWQRARTREANRIAEIGLLLGAATVYQNTAAFFAARVNQSEDTAEYGRMRFNQFLGRADQLLAERTWLAGEAFSVADITAICGIDFGRASGLEVDRAEHPQIARWLDAIRERPSCALKKKS